MTDIQTALFALRDPAYQAFQSKLIPTIDPQTVIGVRMPVSYTHLTLPTKA